MKRKQSRAKHDWAVWQVGHCSHVKSTPKCPCAFEFGFEIEDITNLIRNESCPFIRLTGKVKENCAHIKNKLYERCAGVDRKELRREQAFKDNVYVGFSAKGLYDNHKPGHKKANQTPSKWKIVTGKKLPHVTIRSRKVARNMGQESHQDLLDHYGFQRGDTMGNLYTAAQRCKDQDASIRRNLLKQHGPSAEEAVSGDNYLGILRHQSYDDVSGNRGTTPFNVQYFTKNGVRVYHEICKRGRGVLHIDGTKSRVKFGTVVKDGDKVQCWQLIASPVFAQQSHSNDDPNKFYRENFSPVLLSESHMTETTTPRISSMLERFFHAQWLVCKDFVMPLVVKSDCAKGLCAAVFMALTLEGAPVATRITYNNFMLVVLAYCAACDWQEGMLGGVLAWVLTVIPCLYSLCRPHAIRAAYHWINDKKRCTTVCHNRRVFKDLVVNWLRHCTCTISLSESIVNAALVIYSIESERILVDKSAVLSNVDSVPSEDIVADLECEIRKFVIEAVDMVQKELADDYKSLTDKISDINSRNYRSVPIVKKIVELAKERKLRTTYTMVKSKVDDNLFVETAVCCGYYPPLPDKKRRPTEDDFRTARSVTWATKTAGSKLKEEHVKGINTDAFMMPNPVLAPSVSSYIYDEWVKVIASLTCDIPRLCRQAVEAEVDNSNQVSEAGFKHMKNNSVRAEYSKNAGTFTMFLWEQDKKACSLFVNDVEHLPIRLGEHFNRRTKRYENALSQDQENDVMEESQDVPFEDGSLTRLEVVRRQMNEYLKRNEGRIGIGETKIYNCIRDFFRSQTPLPVPFCSKITLFNYLSGETKKSRFNDKQLDTFVNFMRDEDVISQDQLTEVVDEEVRPIVENQGEGEGGDIIAGDATAKADAVTTSLVSWDNSDQDAGEVPIQHKQETENVRIDPFEMVPYEECSLHDSSSSEYEWSDAESYICLEDDEEQNAETNGDETEEEESDEPVVSSSVDPPSSPVDPPRFGVTMHENEQYGKLASRVRRYRQAWGLLKSYRQIPRRVKLEIMDHVRKCVLDGEFAKRWANVLRTPVTNIVLTEDECMGEEQYMAPDEIVRDRVFLDDQISFEPILHNASWSMALSPNLDDMEREVFARLEKLIPDNLFPKKADEDGNVDVNEMLKRFDESPWLDDLRKAGRFGSVNGAHDNRQPMRRTVSISLSDIYRIKDPVNEKEKKRWVMKMIVYTCREMKPERWMSRPMTNLEFAAILLIWMKSWPYLPEASRKYTPTVCQYCIYHKVMNKSMGRHRDNFEKSDLEELAYETGTLREGGKWCGVENSQVKGSAVLVYTMGNCPMKMVFRKLSKKGGATQDKDMYEIEPRFCFRFKNGWISILDPIDDLLMLHSVVFEGKRECTTPGNPNEF